MRTCWCVAWHGPQPSGQAAALSSSRLTQPQSQPTPPHSQLCKLSDPADLQPLSRQRPPQWLKQSHAEPCPQWERAAGGPDGGSGLCQGRDQAPAAGPGHRCRAGHDWRAVAASPANRCPPQPGYSELTWASCCWPGCTLTQQTCTGQRSTAVACPGWVFRGGSCNNACMSDPTPLFPPHNHSPCPGYAHAPGLLLPVCRQVARSSLHLGQASLKRGGCRSLRQLKGALPVPASQARGRRRMTPTSEGRMQPWLCACRSAPAP